MTSAFRKGRLLPPLFFLCFLIPSLPAQARDMLSGPLYGKNYYLPHLPVYSFPGFSPRAGGAGESFLSLSFGSINEFVAYDTESAALDYESTLWEGGYGWRPADDLLLRADIRLISYYGGVFDPVIENFHSLFGFANGGREYFDRNRLLINLDNRGGRDIRVDGPVLSPGDTDLSGIWTFREESDLVLAAAGAVKLPTGSLEHATGSGSADLGLQILAEWLFRPGWSLNFQQGAVIPGDWLLSFFLDGEPYATRPVSQTTLALGYSPRKDWRILAQTRINTSPVRSDRMRTYSLLGTIPLFSLPQTSLMLGFKKSFDPWGLQIYFEEDPLTYEGADILLNVRISRVL